MKCLLIIAILALVATNTNAEMYRVSSSMANDAAITETVETTISTSQRTWTLSSLKHPAIIGHRGASGYLPDHTIPGYTLAIETGVDVIEPDLVSTKDGVLVVRHEPYIDHTTNIADHPEFAARRTNKTLDGIRTEGFFVSDFTLAEIKTLRAVQPLPERDQSFNGQYEIPTFEEVIQLAQQKSIEFNRTIAIYPEVKHSSFHKFLDLPIENTMLELLSKYGLNHANAPVFIQSFETQNLRELNKVTNLTLVQLIDGYSSDPITGEVIFQAPSDRPYDWTLANRTDYFGYLTTPAGLAEVATYADIISPWKRYILKAKISTGNSTMESTKLGPISDANSIIFENRKIIDDAHSAGLKVHTWTMRDEKYRLAVNYSGNATLEYWQLFDLGVDGLFSDNCKTAVPARESWLNRH